MVPGSGWRVRFRKLIAAVITLAPLLFQPAYAHAEPAQSCVPPPDDVMFAGEAAEPYASEVTCENPDGSYTVCSAAAAAGNGPTNCTNYPAASTQPQINGASPPVGPAPGR